LSQPDTADEDCRAIQQALDEMDAGDRGTSWEVFDAEFRQKHNLPSRSLGFIGIMTLMVRLLTSAQSDVDDI
jgi:hypothetical protein